VRREWSGFMIQHLIFDMDGTLADTVSATVPAFAEVSPRYGLPPVSGEDIRRAVGLANPEFYYRLFPGHDQARILSFAQDVERAEETYVRRLGEAMLFPGVREMLDRLVRMDVDLHIASTGDPAHVDVVLRSAGILHLFRSIHCGESTKDRMVGEIIGASDKCEWAMVGDRQKDIDAARANGIPVIGAGFGYVEHAERALYDRVADSPAELVLWIEAQDLSTNDSLNGRLGFTNS
jgi:phosphoglycolate phosphatase